MDPGDDTDLHTLAGPYALDAVGETERARFEQHLADCGECREEIRGLREATARLAQAAAVRPRDGLKAPTLRAAARIRQLPPVVDAADEVRQPPADQVQADGGSGRNLAGARLPVRRRVGWRPGLALAAAGALAAAVVVLALFMSGTQHRLDQAQGRSQAIAAVLNAADVTMLTADVRTGGTATVLMSHQRRALVFTAKGLQPLPPTQRYELWLMGRSGVRPAGLLPASSAGMVGPMVVSGLRGGDRIGLTVEPSGGSPRPTSAPVLLLGLGPR